MAQSTAAAIALLQALDAWEQAMASAQDLAYAAGRPLLGVHLACPGHPHQTLLAEPLVRLGQPSVASAHALMAWKRIEADALAILIPAAQALTRTLHQRLPVITGPTGSFTTSWAVAYGLRNALRASDPGPLKGRHAYALDWQEQMDVNFLLVRGTGMPMGTLLLLLVQRLGHLGPTSSCSHTVHGSAIYAASPEEALILSSSILAIEHGLEKIRNPRTSQQARWYAQT